MGQQQTSLKQRLTVAYETYLQREAKNDDFSTVDRPSETLSVQNGSLISQKTSVQSFSKFDAILTPKLNRSAIQYATLNLNDEQKMLIRKSWSDDFDALYAIGSCIYVEIFKQAPEAKALFPALAAHGENWQDSKEFRNQALKFVQIISLTVRNLNNMSYLDAELLKVGAKHVKFIERGFKPEYWELFQGSMQVAITQQIMKNCNFTELEAHEAQEAWKIVSDYIVARMVEGFLSVLSTKTHS